MTVSTKKNSTWGMDRSLASLLMQDTEVSPWQTTGLISLTLRRLLPNTGASGSSRGIHSLLIVYHPDYWYTGEYEEYSMIRSFQKPIL